MLHGFGADAQITGDDILITGSQKLKGGTIDSFGDHRIVMAAALASCWCEDPVIINDAEAVSKSYPNFFKDFHILGGCVEFK
jgi:3-phosphoshikimate 1-carboxyvinyltransferase